MDDSENVRLREKLKSDGPCLKCFALIDRRNVRQSSRFCVANLSNFSHFSPFRSVGTIADSVA